METPISKTPKRLRATRVITKISPMTTPGNWSWAPQPTSPPLADLITSIMIVSAQKKTRMPRAKVAEWAKTFFRSSPACPTKDITFSEITGKTQGITFRMMPPRKAARSTPNSPPPKGSSSGVAVEGEAVSGVLSGSAAVVPGSPVAGVAVAVTPLVESSKPVFFPGTSIARTPANSGGAAVRDSCFGTVIVTVSPATVTAASAKGSRTSFFKGWKAILAPAGMESAGTVAVRTTFVPSRAAFIGASIGWGSRETAEAIAVASGEGTAEAATSRVIERSAFPGTQVLGSHMSQPDLPERVIFCPGVRVAGGVIVMGWITEVS